MIKRFIFLITSMMVIGTTILLAAPARQGIDFGADFSSEWRWDAITPQKILGSSDAILQNGIYYIAINDAGNTFIPVPKNQILRVQLRHSQKNNPNQEVSCLSFLKSNGSNLWRTVQPTIEKNTGDLIFPADLLQDNLIRPILSSCHHKLTYLAFFTSRQHPISTTNITNDKPINPLSSSYTLSTLQNATPELYWLTTPNHPYQDRLLGPTWIRIDSYLPFHHITGRAVSIKYWFALLLDHQVHDVLNAESALNEATVVYHNNAPELVGQQQHHYLFIPKGTHDIELTTLQPTLLRVTNENNLVNRTDLSLLVNHTAWLKQLYQYANNKPSDAAVPQIALHKAHQWQPNSSALTHLENIVNSRYSAFRNLLPSNTRQDNNPAYYGINLPAYQLSNSEHPTKIYPESYLRTILSHQRGSAFFTLPSHQEQALFYPLPVNHFPTWLQIMVVKKPYRQIIFYQVNQDIPKRLYLETDDLSHLLPPHQTGFDIAAKWIAIRHSNNTNPHPSSLALYSPLLPHEEISFTHLILPRTAKSIRIWQENSQEKQSTQVSLQIRMATQFELNETEYHNLTQALPTEFVWKWFVKILSAKKAENIHHYCPDDLSDLSKNETLQHSIAKYELCHHWSSLLNFLRMNYLILKSHVGPKLQYKISNHATPIAESVRRATMADSLSDWETSLSAWNSIRLQSDTIDKNRAIDHIITQLTVLKQFDTLGSILLYDYFYTQNPQVRMHIYSRLVHLYRQQHLDIPLQNLTAAELWQHPSATAANDLADILLRRGQFNLSLMVNLLVPKNKRPIENMLLLTYKNEWWNLFSSIATQDATVAQREKWLGYQAQFLGNNESAFTHWKQAGTQGIELRQAFTQGWKIHQSILNHGISPATLTKWSAWQESLPGGTYFISAPWLISASAGGNAVINAYTSATSWLYRSMPHNPVKIHVLGPTQLKISIHTLKSAQSTAQDETRWITFTENKQRIYWPLLNTSPSLDLRQYHSTAPNNALLSGEKIILHIPTGYHDIRIESTEPLLIDVQQPVSILPLASLPGFSLSNVNAISSAPYPARLSIATQPIFIAEDDGTLVNFSAFYKRTEPTFPISPIPSSQTKNISIDRQQQPLSEPERAIVAKMIQLLRTTQFNSSLRLQAVSQGEVLYRQHPNIYVLHSLWSKINEYGNWELLENVIQSGGVEQKTILGYHPESIEKKLSRSLSASTLPSDQLLSNDNQLTITLNNPEPTILTTTFTLLEPAQKRAIPAMVNILLEHDSRHIPLTPEQPKSTTSFNLKSGKHAITFRLLNPTHGQLIRLSLAQKNSSGTSLLIARNTRLFQITRKNRPVKILISGPTALRIDRYSQNDTHSEYRYVPPGKHTISIAPTTHEPTTRLRIYKRVLKTPHIYRSRDTVPLAEKISHYPAKSWIKTPHFLLRDDLSLAGQGAGTPGFSGAHVTRFDDNNELSSTQSYFQAAANYFRKRDEHDYYQMGAVVRARLNGTPTLGLSGNIENQWQPSLSQPRLKGIFNINYYQQNVAAKTRFTLDVKTKLKQERQLYNTVTHTPYIAWFLHQQTLNSVPQNYHQTIDLDIFSYYFLNHKNGLKLGDQITYRPWIDTDINTGIQIDTTERYNLAHPDVARYHLTALRQFGTSQAELTYRWNYFFANETRQTHFINRRISFTYTYDAWRYADQRIELSAGVTWDPKLNRYASLLQLTWYGGNGRGLLDLTPEFAPFKTIRQQYAPKYNIENNNYALP